MAWEFIADLLESGHPIEEVELHSPPGRKGYVMLVDAQQSQAIYIKLQMGSGKIIGRSFHYSYERVHHELP